MADSVAGIYVLMALVGVANATFFLPFQVFMKAVDAADNKSVAYSAGMYTFAWSMGFAMGPFVSGLLMELGSAGPDGSTSGWKYACLFAGLASAVTGAGVYLLRHLVHGQPASPECRAAEARTTATADYSRMPDLAWLGWVSGGVGVVLISFIRAVFPSRSESELHLSQSALGIVFFLVSLLQSLTGLVLCRSRHWMYRPWAGAAFGGFGMAGMLALGFGRDTRSRGSWAKMRTAGDPFADLASGGAIVQH